eukprot:2416978-Alexandrium_andersonii.AAC.1
MGRGPLPRALAGFQTEGPTRHNAYGGWGLGPLSNGPMVHGNIATSQAAPCREKGTALARLSRKGHAVDRRIVDQGPRG